MSGKRPSKPKDGRVVQIVASPEAFPRPTNIEAEASLIGLVLHNPTLFPEVHLRVTSDDFTDEKHKIMWAGIVWCVTNTGTVTCDTLIDRLRRDETHHLIGMQHQYLKAQAGEETLLDPSAVAIAKAVEVSRCAKLRRGVEAGLAFVASCSAEQRDPGEVMGFGIETIHSAMRDEAGKTFHTDKELADRFEAAMDAPEEMGDRLTSGFAKIDFKGVFRKKQLSLVVGRPSMGKTTLQVNFAHQVAARREPALFFTMEMSADELVIKRLGILTGQNTTHIQDKRFTPEQRLDIKAALDEVRLQTIETDETDALTSGQIRVAVMMAKAKHPDLQWVFVDGIYRMTHPVDRCGTLRAAIGATAQELKAIAKKFDVHVCATHQLNRGPEHRANAKDRESGAGDAPTMADLYESGELEQQADVILAPHRARTQTVANPDFIFPTSLHVLKNRTGETGVIQMMFYAKCQRFVEVIKKP